MYFGVSTAFTGVSPLGPVELGRAVEAAGFESLFVPEHTHIPVSRLSPLSRGGGVPEGTEMSESYKHFPDPFVVLSAIAAVTTRLKLGTGVCLVVEHDPITLAKTVASLDSLSGGRVLFGVGGGWNYEEMANHGTKPALRWKLLRERILAMKAIWTQEEAEYHGEFVNFDPLWSWPKPVQRPHPSILVGGNGPGTLQRVLEYGDEWFPLGWATAPSAPELPQRISELQRLAQETGRGPIPVTLFGVPPDPALIERYAAAGVTRCLFGLGRFTSVDEVSTGLEQLAQMARRFGEPVA